MLGASSVAQAAAFYSVGAPVVATPTRSCATVLGAQVCTGSIQVTTGAAVNGLPLAASVYVPVALAPNAVLRLKLTGTAPAGYRAGVLVSTSSALAAANLLGAITLRTYLSTNSTAARDTRVVSGSVLQAQLLNGGGLPQQLELLSTQSFDEVEVEFAAALTVGLVVDVRYAYGIRPTQGTQLTGYLSRFDPATTSLATKYSVDNSCANVGNPDRAVDYDLTNAATFATLATVNCNGLLRVKLNGTAPGTYRAGFVIGRTNDILDAGILANLVLRAYYHGTETECSGAGLAVLELSLLPDGRSLVSFQAAQPFDEVSLERTGLVTLLDNLQLYFGVGVASASVAPLVYSSFSDGAGHAQAFSSGVACVNCGVVNADSAAGPDLDNKAQVQKTTGVVTSVGLRLDLNGNGLAGNRAGVVLGRNSFLDLTTLQNVTIITLNASNEVLESAEGADLLALTLLPNNRYSISFPTTVNFAKVGVRFRSALSALDTNSIFYAFADSTSGTLNLAAPPASPLPVTLTHLAVRQLTSPGPAEVTWTTASEQSSAYFAVERATNPASGFQAVGQVAAAGTSLQPRYYRFLDTTPAPGVTRYYRLRQVDADGRTTFSQVVVLAADQAAAGFSLYPNPVATSAGAVTMQAGGELAPGASVSVYSSLGQLLIRQAVRAGAGEASQLSTVGLAPGLYQVVLRDAGGQPTGTQRLLVR